MSAPAKVQTYRQGYEADDPTEYRAYCSDHKRLWFGGLTNSHEVALKSARRHNREKHGDLSCPTCGASGNENCATLTGRDHRKRMLLEIAAFEQKEN